MRQAVAGCDGQVVGRDCGTRGRTGDLAPVAVAGAGGPGGGIAGLPVGNPFSEARRTQQGLNARYTEKTIRPPNTADRPQTSKIGTRTWQERVWQTGSTPWVAG